MQVSNENLFIAICSFWGVVDLASALYMWFIVGWPLGALGFTAMSILCFGLAVMYINRQRKANR